MRWFRRAANMALLCCDDMDDFGPSSGSSTDVRLLVATKSLTSELSTRERKRSELLKQIQDKIPTST